MTHDRTTRVVGSMSYQRIGAYYIVRAPRDAEWLAVNRDNDGRIQFFARFTFNAPGDVHIFSVVTGRRAIVKDERIVFSSSVEPTDTPGTYIGSTPGTYIGSTGVRHVFHLMSTTRKEAASLLVLIENVVDLARRVPWRRPVNDFERARLEALYNTACDEVEAAIKRRLESADG